MAEENTNFITKITRKATNRRVLKLILNLWTILTMVLFTFDFFSGNKYDSSAGAAGIIYLGILGIYITEKEYTRWEQKRFISRFLGEGFVGFWTALMMIFVILATFSKNQYHVPSEFTVVYTSVIAAFAISQHSKALRHQKEEQKNQPLAKN